MVIVILHYGQYNACNIIKYRTQRLFGLTKELSQEGYDVELIPSQHWDRLEIEISGRIVFRCRLSYLEFNSEANEDMLALKALHSVKDTIQHKKLSEPVVPPVGTITAKAGQISLIQRNMLTIIDACSILEDINASNKVNAIRILIDPSTIDKDSLIKIKEECTEWKIEVSNEDIRMHVLLDSLIESSMMISNQWDVVEPLLKAVCKNCSECLPYCRCSISTMSSEILKEACSVCGPYCVCKRVPSSELIELCRRCGSKTCICSSSSEGSIEICTIALKSEDNEEKLDQMTPINVFCEGCDYLCVPERSTY